MRIKLGMGLLVLLLFFACKSNKITNVENCKGNCQEKHTALQNPKPISLSYIENGYLVEWRQPIVKEIESGGYEFGDEYQSKTFKSLGDTYKFMFNKQKDISSPIIIIDKTE